MTSSTLVTILMWPFLGGCFVHKQAWVLDFYIAVVLFSGAAMHREIKSPISSASINKIIITPPPLHTHKHSQNKTTKDHHVYYTSVFHPPGAMANSLWFDISNLPDRENVNLSDPILSNNYRFFAVSTNSENTCIYRVKGSFVVHITEP